jgi:hypothetical protein
LLARAGRVRSLADREDDVLGQLREQQDVGDVRVERLLEQAGEPPDATSRIGARVCSRIALTLVGRERRAAGGVQDASR